MESAYQVVQCWCGRKFKHFSGMDLLCYEHESRPPDYEMKRCKGIIYVWITDVRKPRRCDSMVKVYYKSINAIPLCEKHQAEAERSMRLRQLQYDNRDVAQEEWHKKWG